jgi:hypothetical protein
MYEGGGNQPQASTFPRIRSRNWGVCVLEEENRIASYMSGSKYKTWELAETHIIIIIIGTTALFEPRPSSEASASRPYF